MGPQRPEIAQKFNQIETSVWLGASHSELTGNLWGCERYPVKALVKHPERRTADNDFYPCNYLGYDSYATTPINSIKPNKLERFSLEYYLINNFTNITIAKGYKILNTVKVIEANILICRSIAKTGNANPKIDKKNIKLFFDSFLNFIETRNE